MPTLLEKWPHTVTPRGLRLDGCAPQELFSRLGDKWTLSVLFLLSVAPGERLRFSDLRYGVSGLSPRMLTVTLRHLERDGLVRREQFAEIPPRVEYALTEIGRGMQDALKVLAVWLDGNWAEIECARARFDEQRVHDPASEKEA